MESALCSAGLEPMPEWWRREISRFYQAGKRRLTVRKGRRVFASTCVAPRVAVAEMLYGEHAHIPGSPPLEYVFLSTKREEAANRILGVKAILDLLGVPYSQSGQTLALTGRPAVFKVVTANHRTAVGGTIAFAWADELARWNDDKTGKNPAELVIGTLAPAQATLPDAKLFLISSPFSTNDYHAKQFELGETPAQCVAFGNTWTINPTLTEEQTHLIEPNFRDWQREYAAIPSEAVEENWFGDAVDRAIDDTIPPLIPPGVRPIIALDPAFDPRTPDLFGWAVVTSEPKKDGGRITMVRAVGGWQPTGTPLELAQRVRSEVLDVYDRQDPHATRKRAYSDQFEGYSFAEVAKLGGINLEIVKWTGGTSETSKVARCKAVRLAMLAGDFRIPNDPDLIREFRQVKGVMSSTGNERIEFPRTPEGHCDRVAAVLLGGSIALLKPSTEALDLREPTEGERMRREAVRASEERKRKQASSASGRLELIRKVLR